MKNKHKLGQYFTTNIELRNKVLEFIRNNPECILEPSVGQGDLVQVVVQNKKNVKFEMYEIDKTIKLLNNVPKNVIYGDFINQQISKKYDTIIGNPPFIKTKKGNIYIDFIEKCYNLLDLNGELIFIVPSDFFKLTSASKLLHRMLTNGSFTHIFHPHKENLFENASIDVLVFRYCNNNCLKKEVLYNNNLLHIIENEGLVTFTKTKKTNLVSFKECFHIFVGMVTGKESVYKNDELGNIEIINGENKKEKYIFIDKFPCENKEINKYLIKYKQELSERKIRKFNETNWFEWGAPRNISSIKKYNGQECIYIYNLTRKKQIAFKGKVDYFGGGLIMLVPKKENSIELDKTVEYLNSDAFQENFIFSGRFKIGHRQISNSFIYI